MTSTPWTGITTLPAGLAYDGGMCEWYYTPWENIESWPGVNPSTGELDGEPILKVGAAWFGPIIVNRNSVGYTENPEQDVAGNFFRHQVEGPYYGHGRNSRVILANMLKYKYAIVGKLRAGGCFLLIGGPQYGLEFMYNFRSGGSQDTAQHTLRFVADAAEPAYVLPSFGSEVSLPQPNTPPEWPGGGGGSGSGGPNETAVINFTNASTVTINYTPAMKLLYGAFPTIEVYINEGGTLRLTQLPIMVDAAPPSTSVFTIEIPGGTASGFVVIK